MRQTDVCSEVTCKIKFNTVVSSILSPAIGATSTVNLATTTGTVQSIGDLCDNAWYVNTFAKYENGSLVPDGYVSTVAKTFPDPDSGSTLNDEFKFEYGDSGLYEITEMQVTITPQTLA